MLKAERKTREVVWVELELPEGERFTLPATTGSFRSRSEMTVTRLTWELTEKADNSHPIEASAVESDGCHWTLSLRLSDVPLKVRSALISACQEGDF